MSCWDNSSNEEPDDIEYINDSDPLDDPSLYGTDATEGISLDEIIQKNVSKNIRELRGFFSSNNFVTEKGNQSTNIINIAEKRTYFVPEDRIEDFFVILDECRKEGRFIHYAERQETSACQRSGIMIDFDRYQLAKESQLTDHHFDELARAISKILSDTLNFAAVATDDVFGYKIFIITKPAVALHKPADEQGPAIFKDGFHILIPEVQVSKGYKQFLLQEILNRKVLANVLKGIPHIGDPNDMLDPGSTRNPVCFFGCSKPGKPAYKLTHGYDVVCHTNDGDRSCHRREVDSVLDGKGRADLRSDPFPINLCYEMSLYFYASTFAGQPTWLKKFKLDYQEHLETKIQLMAEKTRGNIIDSDDILASENSVDILTLGDAQAKFLKDLLTILDIKYATVYIKWFAVVCAIAHTSLNYKPLAIWFSHRKPESWSPSEIERVWHEATSSRYDKAPATFRSIKQWAMESSPQSFKTIEAQHYFNILAKRVYENQGVAEHSTAAATTYAMIGQKFVVDVGFDDKTNRSGYIFFEYVTPGQPMKKGEIYKWRKELKPDNIHLFVSEHLPKVYKQLGENIRGRKDNAASEAEAKYWAGVERKFATYTAKLGNDGFQNGIVNQCHYRFRQRGFIEELDSYEDIIGVGNGVLKLGIEPVLIKGFHEYKISKYTETDYEPFNPENPATKILIKAYATMYPEPDVCNFMRLHASMGLDGRESSCIAVFEIGGGQNGKTFKCKMIHNTLGPQYCASGKSTLLTSPNERGNEANSAQMQMRDKRYFYFDEFGKCEVINIARFKTIFNPGWQSGRDLRQTQSNFKNICNPICLSNYDLIIETTDHGTWRRIYYYRNKIKFCRNPNPENPFEVQDDPRFIEDYPNDPEFHKAQLSIMVHDYGRLLRDYGGDIRRVPVPTIVRETEQFRNRQDALNRFLTENLVKSPGNEIGVPSIANKYIEWYGRNVKPNTLTAQDVYSQIDNSRVASALVRRLTGVYYLVGYRIKAYPEEPLAEGEEELVAREITEVQINPNDIAQTPLMTDWNPLEKADHSKDLEFLAKLTMTAPTHIQNEHTRGDHAPDFLGGNFKPGFEIVTAESLREDNIFQGELTGDDRVEAVDLLNGLLDIL